MHSSLSESQSLSLLIAAAVQPPLLLVDNGDTGNEEEGREEKQARDVGLQYLAQDGLWVATLASREEKAQSLLLGQNSERHSSLSCCHALLVPHTVAVVVAALTGSSEC